MGVSGTVGTKPKPGRQPENVQLTRVDRAATAGLGALVLHARDDREPGSAAIRAAIESGEVPLTVCGHCQVSYSTQWRRL